MHRRQSLTRALAALAGSRLAARAQDAGGKADLVLLGGKVVTVDRSSSVAEAVAVKGGRILARGHPGGRDPQGRPRLGHVRPRFGQSQPPGLDQAVSVREAVRICPSKAPGSSARRA